MKKNCSSVSWFVFLWFVFVCCFSEGDVLRDDGWCMAFCGTHLPIQREWPGDTFLITLLHFLLFLEGQESEDVQNNA